MCLLSVIQFFFDEYFRLYHTDAPLLSSNRDTELFKTKTARLLPLTKLWQKAFTLEQLFLNNSIAHFWAILWNISNCRILGNILGYGMVCDTLKTIAAGHKIFSSPSCCNKYKAGPVRSDSKAAQRRWKIVIFSLPVELTQGCGQNCTLFLFCKSTDYICNTSITN